MGAIDNGFDFLSRLLSHCVAWDAGWRSYIRRLIRYVSNHFNLL